MSPLRLQSANIFWITVAALGVMAGGGAALVWAQSTAPTDLDPDAAIHLSEGIKFPVFTNDQLAYRINAEQGKVWIEERMFEFDDPEVFIYGEGRVLTEEIRGTRGRIWPVSVEIINEAGEPELATKFDWELEGEVLFKSVKGYEILASEMQYHSHLRVIASERKVRFRIPAGESEMMVGDAQGFEAAINPKTSAPGEWRLIGPGELRVQAK